MLRIILRRMHEKVQITIASSGNHSAVGDRKRAEARAANAEGILLVTNDVNSPPRKPAVQ